MFTQPLLQSLIFSAVEGMSRTRFCAYLRQSLAFDYSSTEHRERVRLGRLDTVIHAAEQTELYGSAISRLTNGEFDSASVIAQLKPVTKADFRRRYPTGVFSRKPDKDWQYLSTSGTTDRLSVVADFIKRDHRRSSEHRGLCISVGGSIANDTVEIPPNSCNVVCGIDDTQATTIKQLLWRGLRQGKLFKEKFLSDLRGYVERNILLRKHALPPIDPGPSATFAKSLDDCLDIIRQCNPYILRAYPFYLMWLADRARLRKFTIPKLKYLLPYGGLTSSQMIQRIELGFHASFRNVYGTSELGLIAASCGQSPGMHLFEDLFVADIESKSAETNNLGQLVITDLINTAMPIIRYQVGDTARLNHELCPCGRKTARLEILGRLQENLYIEEDCIPSSDVADTFFVDPGIANGRLDEFAPGCFEAAIVQSPDGPPVDTQACEDRMSILLKGRHKRLKCRVVPFLRPETSGKYLFVWPYQQSTKAV